MTLALLVLCSQMPLLASRWREITEISGGKMPFAAALNYTFIGQFFSQVLPSTVSGDAVRMWLLARSGAGWPTGIYSVLIDRVVGVSILAVMVVACLPWTFNIIHDPIARATITLIGFGAPLGALVFLALGVKHLRVMERWWLTRHLAIASRIAWRLCGSVAGARVAALSFVIQLMTATLAWSVAIAAHAAIDFVQVVFLVLPVTLIATIIPLSVAGWGVRESAMILAFSYAGLAESDGLIVSILFGLVNLAAGAIGGIVWVASGYRWRSVKKIEADTLAHDLSR
jgi:uncharacterized membrane protein YbhN (UPF0104 family)